MGRRRNHHDVWGLVAGTAIALGVACHVVVWGMWGLVATSLTTIVSAFIVAVLVGKSVWRSARIGFASGVVLVACCGLVAAFGWGGVILVLVVAATSPLARILLWHGRLGALARRGLPREGAALMDDLGPHEGAGAVPVGSSGGSSGTMVLLTDMPTADDVPALDDPALCAAWRRSYVRLQGSRGVGARLEVVRIRQLYLDELVRRHPAEARQWFASGARAAGNPLPFLSRPVSKDGSRDDVRFDGPGSEAE